LALVVTITVAGALSSKIPFGLADFDSQLHMLVYGALVLVAARPGSTLRVALVVAVVATVLEAIQLWVPSRTFSLRDILMNLVGISIGALGTLAWAELRGRWSHAAQRKERRLKRQVAEDARP
jgi:VanZ family protein